MMRVLMIGNSRNVYGGITSVISQIENHNWQNQNINMQFIPTYDGGSSIHKIIYFMYAYIKVLLKLLFWKPDIVYIHMSHHGSCSRKYLIHRLVKKFKIKDVIHLHGSEFEKWYNEITTKKQEKMKIMLRECDAFIVLGKKWEATIRNIEPKTNTFVLNNSVKIPDVTISSYTNTINVVFLGMLIKRKGVDDLIEAINILKNKNIINNFKFYIAGEGNEKNNLQKKCEEYSISDYVEFTGWVSNDEKKELLLRSNVMVLPSYNEGLPICLLEGMSYGMPIISTNVGDISYAIKDNENGFLIDSGDINQLANSLEKMLDKNLFEKFSYNSRLFAERDFSDKSYFTKLEKVFRI